MNTATITPAAEPPQDNPRRTCRPGGSFVHVRPESGWQAPVHWQTCSEHKKRWPWGQNMITVPDEPGL